MRKATTTHAHPNPDWQRSCPPRSIKRVYVSESEPLSPRLPPHCLSVEGGLRGWRALDGLAGVGAGDRDRLVLLLAGGHGRGLVDSWRGCRVGQGGREAALGGDGGGRVGLVGRGLELEAALLGGKLGLGDHEALAAGGERRRVLLDVAVEVLEVGGREAGRHGVLRKGGGLGTEAGRVGGRLGAELGEVEIGAGLVAHVHGLMQLALGPVAVKDDAVQDDADDFDNELDDDADEGPVLVAC
jgi:hypothetical protein